MKKVIVVLIGVLCIAGALFSGYMLYTELAEYWAEEAASTQLQQYIDLSATAPARKPTSVTATDPDTAVPSTGPSGAEATEPASPDEPAETEPLEDPVVFPVVDFESLQSLNEDVIGWIYIEGTNINYPIVLGDDNQYYTSVMADGKVNRAGSIFMDYRNKADFSDRNTVIYGHNMKNGSMFNNLKNYTDPEFLKEHPTGKIMTPDGNFEFEIIGGYVASLSDAAWQLRFSGDEDFYDWLQESLEKSTVYTGAEVSPGDRIITLSTCSYEFSEARFVLLCRIID